MNPKSLRRQANRARVAREALEANRPDTPPILSRRLEDSIDLIRAVEEGLLRELGRGPTAAERRSAPDG